MSQNLMKISKKLTQTIQHVTLLTIPELKALAHCKIQQLLFWVQLKSLFWMRTSAAFQLLKESADFSVFLKNVIIFFILLQFINADNNVIVGTKSVVGKNTASSFGKEIAQLLDLKDPHTYTGHTWRRTAITWAANAGLSLVQLKSLSGHKSDTVIQGYIEQAEPMKILAAKAFQISPNVVQAPAVVQTPKTSFELENESELDAFFEDDDKENFMPNKRAKRHLDSVFQNNSFSGNVYFTFK